MISSIDDLLYNSGNIDDAGYYHSLKGHFYVARALKNKNIEDFKSAFESFKAGADEQDAYSTYRLASTYCEGFSGVVEQNLDLCKSLMIKSAEMGSEEAQSVVRNKWGQQIQRKVEEEPIYGLTKAGQSIKSEEYATPVVFDIPI
jgi:TPR repeat protein